MVWKCELHLPFHGFRTVARMLSDRDSAESAVIHRPPGAPFPNGGPRTTIRDWPLANPRPLRQPLPCPPSTCSPAAPAATPSTASSPPTAERSPALSPSPPVPSAACADSSTCAPSSATSASWWCRSGSRSAGLTGSSTTAENPDPRLPSACRDEEVAL